MTRGDQRPANTVPVNPVARVFYALGSDLRFRVLVAVKKGYVTKRRIQLLSGYNDRQVRAALGLLEQAGLLTCTREGVRRGEGEAFVYAVTPLAESLVVLARDATPPVDLLRYAEQRRLGDYPSSAPAKYERENPETGDPLPANVVGFPVGSRPAHRSFTSAERGR